MKKFLAVMNVVAWSGFWAFGYLALSGAGRDVDYSETQLMVALGLAAGGLFLGVYAYLKLVRLSEQDGYAKPSNRTTRAARDAAQTQWGKI